MTTTQKAETMKELRALRKIRKQLLGQLKESQGILRDLYAGRSVFGRVLDCIDYNQVAINAATPTTGGK